VGLTECPELGLRNVDHRRQQQPAALEPFDAEQRAGALTPYTDLATLPDTLELRVHDGMIA
jgi:hypothetical protein